MLPETREGDKGNSINRQESMKNEIAKSKASWLCFDALNN